MYLTTHHIKSHLTLFFPNTPKNLIKAFTFASASTSDEKKYVPRGNPKASWKNDGIHESQKYLKVITRVGGNQEIRNQKTS